MLSTVAATLVKDINTVDCVSRPSSLRRARTCFTRSKGANQAASSWPSPQPPAPSRLLQDFIPGQATASASYPYDPPTGPEDLTAVGNSVYFLASNGTDHDVLWTSDGTTTSQVAFSDPERLVRDRRRGRVAGIGECDLARCGAVTGPEDVVIGPVAREE